MSCSRRFALADDVAHVDDPDADAVLVLDLRAAMRGASPLHLPAAARFVLHLAIAGDDQDEIVRALAASVDAAEQEVAEAVRALLAELLQQRCIVELSSHRAA